MEKKAKKKSTTGYLLSLLGKLAVLLLFLLINNLLGFNNPFNRSPKSWSSKDDGKGGKRKRKSCMEDEKRPFPSDGSGDVRSEDQKNKKLKKNVESLLKENRKQENKKKELLQDVHDATVQKKRKDPADMDRVQPPSKYLRGENHIIYGVTRAVLVGNLPFDLKEEELYRQFLGTMPLNQLLRLFEILTQVKA